MKKLNYLMLLTLFITDTVFAEQKNLINWFKGGESIVLGSKTEQHTLPLPLAQLIYSKFGTIDDDIHLPRDDIYKCYGELEPDEYYYNIELGENGMRFILPLTRNYSCGEGIDVTFEELMPFMNRNGLKFMRQIRSNRGNKK